MVFLNVPWQLISFYKKIHFGKGVTMVHSDVLLSFIGDFKGNLGGTSPLLKLSYGKSKC